MKVNITLLTMMMPAGPRRSRCVNEPWGWFGSGEAVVVMQVRDRGCGRRATRERGGAGPWFDYRRRAGRRKRPQRQAGFPTPGKVISDSAHAWGGFVRF